jgi:glycine/D-amino acid oxidase-like deaminating enzyme
MNAVMGRRQLLVGSGALLVGSVAGRSAWAGHGLVAAPPLHRIRISMDRVTGVTVCTRPFRAAGPRLEVEQIGPQSVVHHYGHGGSGWSLSWGSGALAAQMALATGERDVGVIGCGAIGLTTALQLQRKGASTVTIYARDTPPEVRSSFATGGWTPDSRICLESHATPALKQQWQSMARTSWRMYQGLLGLAGDPVEFVESYSLSDKPQDDEPEPTPDDGRPKFARLSRELIPDIGSKAESIDPRSTPFVAAYVRRRARLTFNIGIYTRLLLEDFRSAGGRLVIDEFRSPADFARLPHKTLVNCTGYGARALLGDESIVPVRGQLARLMHEPGVHYGFSYRRVSLTSRRDTIVLQAQDTDANSYNGYNDATIEPDMATVERAVQTLSTAYRPGAL